MASNYVEDNWQSNKGVCDRNKHMLENELETDVVFKVSSPFEPLDVQTIRAHKYMLISASPVFWAMLCGQLREDGDITVPDVATDAFRQMLRFIYTEQPIITGTNVMQVLHAAKKYQLSDLVKRCVDFLDKELNASNACSILDHCQFFGEKQLMSKCLDTVNENTTDALNSGDFRGISNETLGVILDSDNLSMDEVKIFEKSYEWALHKTDQNKSIRDVLGKNLHKIRFPIMPSKSFIEIVCSKDILTDSEQLQILKYMTSPEASAKPAAFCCEARKPSTDSEQLQILKYMTSPEASDKPAAFCCEPRIPGTGLAFVDSGISCMRPLSKTQRKKAGRHKTNSGNELKTGDRIRVLRGGDYNVRSNIMTYTVYVNVSQTGTVTSPLLYNCEVKLDDGEIITISRNDLEKL